MRVIIFFDLPTETMEDKREYRRFRKLLIKNGFLMLQKSVYCRMLLNKSAEAAVVATIKKHKPKSGLVQLLTVTEKQFSKMEFLTGELKNDIIDSDERMIIL